MLSDSDKDEILTHTLDCFSQWRWICNNPHTPLAMSLWTMVHVFKRLYCGSKSGQLIYMPPPPQNTHSFNVLENEWVISLVVTVWNVHSLTLICIEQQRHGVEYWFLNFGTSEISVSEKKLELHTGLLMFDFAGQKHKKLTATIKLKSVLSQICNIP